MTQRTRTPELSARQLFIYITKRKLEFSQFRWHPSWRFFEASIRPISVDRSSARLSPPWKRSAVVRQRVPEFHLRRRSTKNAVDQRTGSNLAGSLTPIRPLRTKLIDEKTLTSLRPHRVERDRFMVTLTLFQASATRRQSAFDSPPWELVFPEACLCTKIPVFQLTPSSESQISKGVSRCQFNRVSDPSGSLALRVLV